jgi:riboflavin synthase alpha subunit
LNIATLPARHAFQGWSLFSSSIPMTLDICDIEQCQHQSMLHVLKAADQVLQVAGHFMSGKASVA